jgi:gliding motility-associated-like protein
LKRTPIFLLLFGLVIGAFASAQAPVANFSVDVSSGCSPLKVKFTDQSTGNNLKYEWNLGNGTLSTLASPSTVYIGAGVYNVTLKVTSPNGLSSTKSATIQVFEDPKASFIADKVAGCAPLTVNFSDKSSTNDGSKIVSWFWDFGNGSRSTEQNPQIKYTSPGTFTVVLRVTTDKGCTKVITENNFIDVSPGLNLNFSNSTVAVCQAPFQLNFLNSSTAFGTVNYKWNFGDGNTSTLENPSNTYQSPGVYNVSLIASTGAGCADTLVKQLSLTESKTDFTTGNTLCENSPINFYNNSSPLPISSQWIFSDGSIVNTKDAVKTFSSAGSYKVTLVNTYSACVDSVIKTITVGTAPKAEFSTPALGQCSSPLTVNFQNTSTGAIRYDWDFGDGSPVVSSTSATASHTFTSNGTFNVKLTAYNNTGCSNIFINPNPIVIGPPSVEVNKINPACAPYGISPSAKISSISPIVKYEWNFGDGTIKTDLSASHTYTSAGNYSLSLTVTTADGCVASSITPVEVGNKSSLSFTASPLNVCASDSVIFNNTSQPKSAIYTWQFGDGGSSNIYDPKYSYNDTGWFQVILFVNNNGCKDSIQTDVNFLFVNAPVARFSFAPNCQENYEYFFTDQSVFDSASVGRRTWLWEFPNGTKSNNQVPPPYTFPGPGKYKIALTVSNGSCTHTKTEEITIVNRTPDFIVGSTQNCKPISVKFDAITPATQQIVNYSWEVNGFDTLISNPSFSYTFDTAGSYDVKLITIDNFGCSTNVTKPILISGPRANFAQINQSDCKNLAASFADSSLAFGNNNITNWKWNFGDGTIVDKTDNSSVEHIYNSAGYYTVTLYIKDASGCQDSSFMQIKIRELVADYTATEQVCYGFPITFNNTSKGEFISANWDFGDSSAIVNQLSPSGTYNYSDTGFYTLKLIIEDSAGCRDTLERVDYVHVSQPIALIEVQDSISFCPPFDVNFRNSSSFFTKSEWRIGNETSTETDHRKLFTQPGTFDVKLTVASPDGKCTSNTEKTIILYSPDDAKLEYDPVQACVPGIVNLNAFDNLASANFFWDLGDGTIVDTSVNQISHTYTNLGSFTPKILLTESSGCVITLSGTEPIKIKGAFAKFEVNEHFYCDSGFVQVLDSTISFNDPIIKYSWDFGDGTISNDTAPRHYYNTSGIYPILLTVETEAGCIDSVRLQTPVKIASSPSITTVGDTSICINGRVQHQVIFDRTDTSAIRWNWQFPNGTTSNQQNPPSQQYTKEGNFQIRVIAENSSGCSDTSFTNINVYPNPVISVPPTITTNINTPVKLGAQYSTNIKKYTWKPATDLSCSDCPQPIATPKFNTNYTISVVDSNGCKNQDEIKVVVLCQGATVFLPNTFSPNGDGVNDIFYVRGQGIDRVKSLRIFNRWGEIVFEQRDFPVNNPQNGWDGRFKGGRVSPDVYVYQVEVFCQNGEPIQFAGNVALIQ